METGNNIITANKLTKKFGDFKAVNEITFDVKKGEIFGFLGANGAGKSTAMKMLTGLLSPTSGEASVAGYDVFTQQEEIKKNIGYMSQKFSLYDDLTLLENIHFFGGIYGLSKEELKDRSNDMIQRLGLSDVSHKLLKEVPLGWKQKIAFSVATIHHPKVVFLDEPTGGVDPITRRQFWELIYEASDSGTTVFVTTHYMDEAEYCNRISMMVDGKIAGYGSPKELKKEFNADNMDEVFVKIARGENYTIK
ncbi:ABC transporter ATP-binding protein [Flammeovirga kamogawensis]|uniref:ABC transporter ATP-binding protein n=1 Tax=Flammeovirga kamogawensis TaxID=373891 RepID=A0ABX8GWG1_9BACT|nr:ABC transporter ATP-binding protein [Flammeovirga kamogawensis]MBB6461175.1 ABC-2 type transport system ATP-binding protein [Flammeovirga kamogawensis]QWG07739.1 ABC transporter ATP-binding protein [Flammeovirga kamogawensis]TRX69545.1 ABC transporter ATP-binding protein [Flammeovirga kamogawensis]